MNLFLDTEFNDFNGPLISMALVPEDPSYPEWYGVLACPDPTPWVKENVIKVLHKTPETKEKLQVALRQYLIQFDAAHVVADWPEDISHFCRFLITGPGTRLSTPKLTFEIHRGLDLVPSMFPHNAVYDARAMAKSYEILKGKQSA